MSPFPTEMPPQLTWRRGSAIIGVAAQPWEVTATAMKHWAKDHDSCIKCGTTDRPHKGRGLCTTCYYRQYERKTPAARANEVDATRAQVVELLAPFLKRYGFSATYGAGRLVVTEQGKRRLDHQF